MGISEGATRPSALRRAFLRSGLVLGPAVIAASLVRAQGQPARQADNSPVRVPDAAERDAMLKADYELNVKDARELTALARSIELNFEKNDENVLSLSLLKQLDHVEKITKRIRGRVKQ